MTATTSFRATVRSFTERLRAKRAHAPQDVGHGGPAAHAPDDAAQSGAGPSSPPPVPRLTLAEFRRRFEAGELTPERWGECYIDPSEFAAPTSDPHSPEYADAVMDVWRALTGRAAYDATVDEVFELSDADYLARPYPYSSGNPTEVAQYFGAVAAAVQRTGHQPPAKLTEYGSGWGHLALALAATGFDVTAVDLNPASVQLLRRRADALGVGLHIAHCDFLDHDPPAQSDVIVFFESFHHCARPFELLDRCTAQLSPGGRLMFLADAIYDDFYVPWGVRLDGPAAFMAAQQGWLELGFRRDFFEAELAGRGFVSTWEILPWLGAYGTVLVAERPRNDET